MRLKVTKVEKIECHRCKSAKKLWIRCQCRHNNDTSISIRKPPSLLLPMHDCAYFSILLLVGSRRREKSINDRSRSDAIRHCHFDFLTRNRILGDWNDKKGYRSKSIHFFKTYTRDHSGKKKAEMPIYYLTSPEKLSHLIDVCSFQKHNAHFVPRIKMLILPSTLLKWLVLVLS